MLRWLADRFLYNNWFPAASFPRAREAAHEDVWLEAADGTRLHARWYACPDEAPAPLGRPRPTVLFFHGNAGDVVRWRHIGSRWQDAIGADVLVLDFRGYGRSRGRPNATGFALDGSAAYEWLLRSGVDPKRLLLVGQSLGGGICAEFVASGVDHAALVLESSFANVREVADGLLWNTLPLGRLLRDAYPVTELLAGYERPLFLSHGDRDRLIPIDHSQRILEVARGPKELLVLPGMGHHDERPDSYGERVREFLASSLAADDD